MMGATAEWGWKPKIEWKQYLNFSRPDTIDRRIWKNLIVRPLFPTGKLGYFAAGAAV
jgi:hypothetical protein